MKISVKTFEENNQISKEKYFGANIFLDKIWFKEITGLSTKPDLIHSILHNEDLLETVNKKSLTKKDLKFLKKYNHVPRTKS